MRKYSFIMMAFVLLIGMAQCKKEQVTPSENNGVNITLKVDGGSEKLNVFPSTGAVVFTDGDEIYVGNNGKYVGTLTYSEGLFQGTISGDLSTEDYLHVYFVGNKPTSPAALTAGSTTSCTVDISDQRAYLPVISYAPSKAKYSPSTTFYTAQLLNKSALVKFVPAEATNKPITVLGLNNEVQIDFEHNTLAPSGTTGGITLYSVSDTEKWAILLEQAAVSNATVTISGYEASASLPSITNNMYYNAGIGISMTTIYKTYEADNSNWSTVLASFNSESTPNPMLIVKTDISGNWTITREDGTIDFSNHSLSGALFLQNNVLNQTVTVRNGSVERVDGKDGTGDLYNGTVIFDNMTVRGNVSTDAHHYIVQGGTYGVASSHVFEQPYANAPYPALTEIYDGKFMKLAIQYGSGTATTYRLYGGKYNNRPDDSWCAEGYSIRSNTDSDSGTYPYVVKALTEPYEITSSSSDPSVVSFNNAASTPTPTLHFNTDYEFGLNITRANGIVDFNGHSAKELFVKNDVEGESITLQNGTISPNPIDGESGTGTYFKGTVIMENMTVNGRIFTDGHAYIINSGTYNQKICCDTYSGYPGTTTIYGGYFTELGFNSGPQGTYILYGGKYHTRPEDAWCAPGYTIKSNTDSDSGTYPWIVSAD